MPLADATAVKAPEDIADKTLVLMADIFPTGYFAANNAFKDMGKEEISEATVVLIGCGYEPPLNATLVIFRVDFKMQTSGPLRPDQRRELQAQESSRCRFDPIALGFGKVPRSRTMEFPD